MMLPQGFKRMRPPDPRDGWYELQPAQAQFLLERGAKNRPLREFRARRYAADMKAGTWKDNGEALIFDDKDRNVDGQHRLRAIVIANKPAIMYCIFGVNNKHFASIDQGGLRTGGDIAGTMDFSHYSLVAALSRLVMEYQDGKIGMTGAGARIPGDALRLFMERHRERLDWCAAITMKHRVGLVHLVPVSHAAFVAYMNPDAGNDKIADFLEKLATGAGLEKSSPILIFRRRMLDLVGEKHRLSTVERLALMVKTWNAYRTGRALGVLKWNQEVEQFPRFANANGVNEDEP